MPTLFWTGFMIAQVIKTEELAGLLTPICQNEYFSKIYMSSQFLTMPSEVGQLNSRRDRYLEAQFPTMISYYDQFYTLRLTVQSRDSSNLSIGLPTKLAKEALGKLSPANPIFMYPVPGSQMMTLLSIRLYFISFDNLIIPMELKFGLNQMADQIKIIRDGLQRWDQSIGFVVDLSPKFIILSGNCSCYLGDQCFQSSPKVDSLQNWVHPSVDDAIGAVKFTLMMDVMFFEADDKSSFLQELNDWVRFFVYHVCPFVAFVGQNSHYYCEDNHPVACLRKGSSTRAKKTSSNEYWHWIRRGSIGLNEIVNSDILRVDMMHSESPDKGWADDGRSEMSPSIAAPMDQA